MNTATDYAQTLVHMQNTNPDNFSFEKFIGLLKEKNHYKMLPAILEQVQNIQSQKGADKTTLVVRDASAVSEMQSQLDLYKEEFGTEYEVVEDKNIVGGFILKNKTNMLDQSYRTRLLTMYKKRSENIRNV